LYTLPIRPLVLAVLAATHAGAQDRFFAGAFMGIATLSADARFEVPREAAASGYKPENGPAVSPFFGIHLNDYLSFQASYIWNRNDLRYHSLQGLEFYDQQAQTDQHLLLGDALLYFRSRTSWVRPYLSAGTGFAYVSSEARGTTGTLPGAPASFSEYAPVLHVAVGIDLRLAGGWNLRYCFGETMQRNAFSRHLTPPGQRRLAGFRNLFGFVKYF
jgi:hypothetical protein